MLYDLHLARSFASANCHTHSQKNVTYNIALKSTTYVKRNVTLHVTTSRKNVTDRDWLVLLPHRELVQEKTRGAKKPARSGLGFVTLGLGFAFCPDMETKTIL